MPWRYHNVANAADVAQKLHEALDEEVQSTLAGVVKTIALRDAKPQPAGARSLDDAIRALEGVVAVRPSVGPALELLKKERRALK